MIRPVAVRRDHQSDQLLTLIQLRSGVTHAVIGDTDLTPQSMYNGYHGYADRPDRDQAAKGVAALQYAESIAIQRK